MNVICDVKSEGRQDVSNEIYFPVRRQVSDTIGLGLRFQICIEIIILAKYASVLREDSE